MLQSTNYFYLFWIYKSLLPDNHCQTINFSSLKYHFSFFHSLCHVSLVVTKGPCILLDVTLRNGLWCVSHDTPTSKFQHEHSNMKKPTHPLQHSIIHIQVYRPHHTVVSLIIGISLPDGQHAMYQRPLSRMIRFDTTSNSKKFMF